jgi:hypothetical protein
MPQQQGAQRKLVVNSYKLSPTEREHLRRVASERGVSAGELVRQGLRLQGALPSQ